MISDKAKEDYQDNSVWRSYQMDRSTSLIVSERIEVFHEEAKNFFESMMGETPIAPDLFWGTLALLVFVLVQIVFEFTRWSAWFILGAGMVSVLFVIEVRRLRIPLLPKYRSTQKVSLIIIFCMVIVCIVSFFRMMLN